MYTKRMQNTTTTKTQLIINIFKTSIYIYELVLTLCQYVKATQGHNNFVEYICLVIETAAKPAKSQVNTS